MIDRRHFSLSGLALVASCAGARSARAMPGFEDLRGRLGKDGRIVLAALDTGSGKRVSFNANSRFAMASTFKLGLAAALLAESDAGRLSLGERRTVRQRDMFDYAPVVTAAGVGATLTLWELAAAAVQASDNGAANLLIERLGGPSAVTRFFRRCGDRWTRLDRYELDLNSNLPGDLRDTTTPAAMLATMRLILTGPLLAPASRQQLIAWLVTSTRGLDRLRAGLPASWRVGTKAGTGSAARPTTWRSPGHRTAARS